jgi:hypothetical protein
MMQIVSKKLGISISATILTFASLQAYAFDCMDPINYYVQPYMGIDAQWRVTQPVRGFGQNLFKRHYLQGNLYIGAKICDYLGVELGYEMTPTRTKTSTVGADELSLGVPSDPPEIHINKSRIQGGHLGLMGYYPVCNFLGNTLFRNPVELLGYVGVVRLTSYFQDVTVMRGGDPVDVRFNTRTYNDTRNLLRLGLGAQYTYCTSGIRFMIGYEDTSQFRNVPSKEFATTSSMRLKLKDSLFVSLGIFVTVPF